MTSSDQPFETKHGAYGYVLEHPTRRQELVLKVPLLRMWQDPDLLRQVTAQTLSYPDRHCVTDWASREPQALAWHYGDVTTCPAAAGITPTRMEKALVTGVIEGGTIREVNAHQTLRAVGYGSSSRLITCHQIFAVPLGMRFRYRPGTLEPEAVTCRYEEGRVDVYPQTHVVMELPRLAKTLWEVQTSLWFSSPTTRSAAVEQLVVGVATALAHLHAVGLMHGDLKPANIMYPYIPSSGPYPSPVVLDFGAVTPMLTGYTGPSGMCTYCFAAPECMHTGSSAASDVYSLGAIVLAILLDGSSTLARVNWKEWIDWYQIWLKRPVYLAQQLQRLPPKLREVLGMMLDPVPDRRPTAGSLLLLLSEISVPYPYTRGFVSQVNRDTLVLNSLIDPQHLDAARERALLAAARLAKCHKSLAPVLFWCSVDILDHYLAKRKDKSKIPLHGYNDLRVLGGACFWLAAIVTGRLTAMHDDAQQIMENIQLEDRKQRKYTYKERQALAKQLNQQPTPRQPDESNDPVQNMDVDPPTRVPETPPETLRRRLDEPSETAESTLQNRQATQQLIADLAPFTTCYLTRLQEDVWRALDGWLVRRPPGTRGSLNPSVTSLFHRAKRYML